MVTNVLMACSQLAWTIASGPVAGYEIDVAGQRHLAPAAATQACLPIANQLSEIRVRAFDSAGASGPWSDALVLQWVDVEPARAPIRLP